MPRRRVPHQDEPLTVERLERALDGLAMIIIELGEEGRKALPIYARLERELAEMRQIDQTMQMVYARAKRSMDQKAG